MICPKCGQYNPPYHTHCKICGVPLDEYWSPKAHPPKSKKRQRVETIDAKVDKDYKVSIDPKKLYNMQMGKKLIYISMILIPVSIVILIIRFDFIMFIPCLLSFICFSAGFIIVVTNMNIFTKKTLEDEIPEEPEFAEPPQPPPPALRISVYDGLYALPKEEPRLRFDMLGKVAIRPLDAFLALYPNTTKRQGLTVALVLIIIQTSIELTVKGALTSFSQEFMENMVGVVLAASIGIPIALFSVVIMGYFSALISKGMGSGRNDVDKTIGLLGYAAVTTLIVYFFADLISFLFPNTDNMDMATAITVLGMIIILFIVVIFGFVWTLWVNGYAVSVANDIPLKHGILTYLVAMLIGSIIILFITEIVSIIVAIFI